jgi:TRAP-type C4-dicarboxylate transport system permease small subunit
MSLLSELNGAIDKLLRKACAALLGVFTLAVLLQIATRNYIKIPMDWTEEVALFCFLWSVYLGSAVAVRARAHYIIELFPERFVLANALLNTFSDFFIFSLILVLIWGGGKFTMLGLARDCMSIPISMAWLFVAIPISGGVMFLFGLENLWQDFINLKAAINRSGRQ